MQEQLPALTPFLVVRDPRSTIAWFQQLGFTLEYLAEADGVVGHAEVSRGPSVRIMFGPSLDDTGSAGMSLYVTLQNGIDAFHDRVVAAGVPLHSPLTDQFWGARTFEVMHPDGYRLTFAQDVHRVSPEEIGRIVAEDLAAIAGA